MVARPQLLALGLSRRRDPPAGQERAAAPRVPRGLRGRASRHRAARPAVGGGPRVRRGRGAEPLERRRPRGGCVRRRDGGDARERRTVGARSRRASTCTGATLDARRDHDPRRPADHHARPHDHRPRGGRAARPQARGRARRRRGARARLLRPAPPARPPPRPPRRPRGQRPARALHARHGRHPQRPRGHRPRPLRRARHPAAAQQRDRRRPPARLLLAGRPARRRGRLLPLAPLARPPHRRPARATSS